MLEPPRYPTAFFGLGSDLASKVVFVILTAVLLLCIVLFRKRTTRGTGPYLPVATAMFTFMYVIQPR
jgi:hypothetical protein